MLLGKTFSFTPDEANVDDLAKACDFTINLFCLLENPDLVSYAEKTCYYHDSSPSTIMLLKDVW